ncbi:hypothetical protein HO133_005341 [Letharia lupina]|uniref:Transcription factor domain-containing protein n=1 Tax=Letharia lupina TaxID=560253 RepID=A0A8H6C8P3_9LECA|nr:uncharacterized protein HO133_005341 [Letharia lupina]KAF6218798.1 hypothetical protein HO133_005341 [Letharia lupina]
MSLDSNASTAGLSIATPQSINLDAETTAVKILGGAIAPADLVCTTTVEKLSIACQGMSQLDPHEQEAQDLLLEFKENMTEQFPFVVVDPYITSQSLHQERPLLWKAIIIAASHGNSYRQMVLGADLMEDLTKRLLLRAEVSLDLLQALLVFIAWYHYHTLVNPQITNLLHLTKALINNMGLNRTQTTYDRGKFFLDGHESFKPRTQSSHGLESSSCRGLEPQFNTSYILECCHKLEEAGEYQSDVVLAQLVRLQEIWYRMSRSFPYDESLASRRPDAPVEMFVRAWQKELETFWASLPVESQQNSKPPVQSIRSASINCMSTQELLLATYHTTQIALYEIDFPMCLPRVGFQVFDRTGRLEFIYASLLATRKVFGVYSSILVGRLSGICFTLWAQFNYALLNAVKLLTTEADGWDLQHARNVLTFPDILHSQVTSIEETISRRGLVLENAMYGKDVFIRFLRKVHHALRWYESSRVSRIEYEGMDDKPTDPNGSLETTDTGESLPVFDDAFWQTLFDDNWMLVGDGTST